MLKVEKEKIAVEAAALISIMELSDKQLAAINLAVHYDQPCKTRDGYDMVSHLFDEEGYILGATLKHVFVDEVNRRLAEVK